MSYIKAIIDGIRANPIRAVAFIRSVILVGAAFGLSLTQDQTTAILTLAGVLLVADEAVRSQVTPTSDPKLQVGDTVTTPQGTPAVVVPATPSAVDGAVPSVINPDA